MGEEAKSGAVQEATGGQENTTPPTLFTGTVVCSPASMVLRSGRALPRRPSLQTLREHPLRDDSDSDDEDCVKMYNSHVTDAPRPARRGVPIAAAADSGRVSLETPILKSPAKKAKSSSRDQLGDLRLDALPLQRSGCSDLLGDLALPLS